jgi:hypothetical protein
MADALPPPRSPENKWQGRKADPAQRRPPSRRGRNLFLLTALALAILGATLAIVLYPNRMTVPHIFLMAVREYQSPLLPPNAWCVQDGQRIARCFGDRKSEFYDKQGRDNFTKFLAQLEEWRDGPLVVHLSALGRVYNDEVVLFLGDGDPDQPSSGMPLKRVLQSMAGKTPGDRLLLLDIARPVADARIGVLADDLAAAVARELTEAEKINPETNHTGLPFFVLASCAPGQMSHVSEELGASVFAYYVEAGLRGYAEPAHGNQRVTVHELAEFLKKHVDRWVWVNRGQRQEPQLFGKAKDFPLAQLGVEPPSMPELPKERPYPDWLKKGWQVRDELYRDGSYRRAPWAFRRLELTLLRNEKRWRAGVDDDESRIGPDVTRNVAAFKEAIAKANSDVPQRAFSLAELRDENTVQAAKQFQFQFDRYLEKIVEPGAKVDESDKVRVETVKKMKAELIEELKKVKGNPAAVIVTAAVRPPNLTPGRILALVDLMNETGQGNLSGSQYAETVFLERLKDLIEGVLESAEWPGATAHLALQVEIESEDVLAEIGRMPAALAWNKDLLIQGENQRRRGDKDLFRTTNFTFAEAPRAYLQAEQAYRPILLRFEILKQILQQRDQAFVHVTGWAPYWIAMPRGDLRESSAWKGCVTAARGLADLVDARDPSTLEGEPTALTQWQAHSAEWRKAIDARIQRLNRLKLEGKAAEYNEWQALLESPRFSAEDREAYWKASRELGLKLIESTPTPDVSDADVQALGIVPGEDTTSRQESDRKDRRVQLAFDLLDLSSYKRSDGTTESIAKGREGEAVAGRLQVALSQGVPGQFVAALAKRDDKVAALGKADRLSRVFAEEVFRRTASMDSNPALALHRLNREAVWEFLRGRYDAESRALSPQQRRHALFYDEARQAYSRLAP